MSRMHENVGYKQIYRKISPDQKYKPIKVLCTTSLTYQGFYEWIIWEMAEIK